MIKHDCAPQVIAVGDLKVDHSYQRTLSNSLINSISNNFDSGLVGSLIVSKRDDGFYVIDGQHRLYALRKNGVKSVLCTVYFGLTLMQEARLFVMFNGNRKKPTALELFNARIASGDPSAVEINLIVRSCGFTLGKNGGQAINTIIAVKAIEKTYKQLGAIGLNRILNLLKETWNGTVESLDNHMLNGMRVFVSKANNHFTDSDFISRMKKVDPVVILREAKALGSAFSNDYNLPCAIVLAKYYNHGRSSKRIPENLFYLSEIPA